MTKLTAAEWNALPQNQKGKGGKKALGPIKMPATEKPAPQMETQLDLSDTEKALDRLQFSVADGCYMEHHPTHRIIITKEGFEFILKPLKK